MCPLCLSAIGLLLSAGGIVAFAGLRRPRSSTAEEEEVA